MTITDEILSCANQLANAGKKPSVALVKAKLSQPVPLPTIIATLKNWQHEPEFTTSELKEQLGDKDQDTSQSNTELVKSLLNNDAVKSMIEQSLAKELQQLKVELAEMKLQIEDLTKQLHRKK